ncbi:MAG: sulfurtransferase TusA family protein [Candidatus Hodarchaeales archaeon]
MVNIDKTLDARGLSCPKPILQSRKTIKSMKINQVLEIITTDPGSVNDIPAWASVTGQELLSSEERSGEYHFLVKKLK